MQKMRESKALVITKKRNNCDETATKLRRNCDKTARIELLRFHFPRNVDGLVILKKKMFEKKVNMYQSSRDVHFSWLYFTDTEADTDTEVRY